MNQNHSSHFLSIASHVLRLAALIMLGGTSLIAATAPLISQQPASQTVTAGSPVTFTVSAIGDPALAYQWKKAGADIPGATVSSYAIGSVQASDAAAYTVTISNGAGNQISAPAILVVGTKHILYVKANAAGSNNGSSWTDAYTSLTSALSAAIDGDEIWVAAGTYKPSSTGDRNAYFSITKVLTILGGFAGGETDAGARNFNINVTTLSGDLSGNDTGPGGNQGDNSKRVVVFEGSANAIVDGLNITGGNAPGGGNPDAGGGLFVGDGCVATTRNCTFYWNYALSYGGALAAYSFGGLTVEGCYFHGNAAPYNGGGGMIAYGFSYMPMPHCIIKRSAFANNSGSAAGGLLLYGDLTAYLENCVFSGNSSGGGLQSGNAAGAIRGFTGAPGRFWVTNCTFSANTNTRGTAGAVSLSAPNDNNSILANSIIIGSGSNPVSFSPTANLLSDQTISGANNSVATPTFVNSASILGADGAFGTRDDGFMLTASSPGVNSASATFAPTTDATGSTRSGGPPDHGAYETSLENTITLPLMKFVPSGSPPLTLPAAASSGLPISYEVIAGEGVATVTGNTVTLAGQKGAVTIRARQEGGGVWPAAIDAYLSFRVDDAPIWKKVFTGSGAPGYWIAALREDGTIWTWGSNASANLGVSGLIFRRRPLQMGSDSDWAELSAPETGYSFAAIKRDGRLFTWGNNGSGQMGIGTTTGSRTPVSVDSQTDWAQVASGGNHMIALKRDGSLWAWGLNSSGHLGDGSTTSRNVPTQIGADTDWVLLAAGGASSHAIKSDGTLWAWGNNSGGRLGDGTTTNRTSPLKIGTSMNWVAVDGGNNHTLGLKSDGTLWAWGTNANGQVGDGTQTNRTQPVQVMAGSTWAKIHAGRENSMAIRTDGTLWAWGLNSRGQLGIGNATTQLIPVQVGTATDWKEVAVTTHSVAIKLDKTMWSWGTDGDGELGNGSWWPQPIAGTLGHVASFSSGRDFTAIVEDDGSLWTMGTNTHGQLGLGLPETTIIREPGRVGADSDWATVSAGQHHAVALKADGSVWSWGRNTEGQLGDGTNTDRTTPVRVGTSNDWASASAGYNFTVGIRPDASLWTWGSNANGELGDGTQTSRNAPARVGTDTDWLTVTGYNHCLGIKRDGSLWGWGLNSSGQVGDGSTSAHLSPTRIGTDSNWARVSAGNAHSLGLRTNGTLWAWGSNTWGETTIGARSSPGQVGTVADWADIAAGSQYTLALKRDGGLWSSGSGFAGRLAHGAGAERDAYNLWSLTRVGGSSGYRQLPDGGIKLDRTLVRTATGELWGAGPSTAGGEGMIRFRPTPKPVFSDLTQQTLVIQPKTIAAYGVPIKLNAAATSGLPISYDVSGPASIQGDELTVHGPGRVWVTAKQLGDDIWDAAPLVAMPGLLEVTANTSPPLALNSGQSGRLDFGPVLLGSQAAVTLRIKNDALSVGDISGCTATLTGSGSFQILTQPTSGTLEPGAETTFTVSFAPSDFRPATAQLVVASSGAANNQSIIITLIGNTAQPEISVEQPIGTGIANGGTRDYGIVVAGTSTTHTFAIRNTGTADLTGLTITKDGADEAMFTVTASPIAPVSGPSGSTTFTVRFAPTTAGAKTAALHIANNDPDENPFDITLTGQALSFTQDTDGDGLNDASEFNMQALGFDWQVNQTSLVNSLFSNANGAGLYTPTQVQALNVGVPLIQKTGTNGQFKLIIGVKKSTNLIQFDPFPMTSPHTTLINAQGELEFNFTVPDNAAFFRLQVR
ncbi:MAG: choice-of-anchor D domain-containing protein [Verrucomicrobiaceae bacterium]